MTLLMTSKNNVLNPRDPPNVIIEPNQNVKAVSGSSKSSLIQNVRNSPVKYAVFAGVLFLAYKYLRRKS